MRTGINFEDDTFEKCISGETVLIYDKLTDLKKITPEICEEILREWIDNKNEEAWRWYQENGKINANFVREWQSKIDFYWHLSHNDHLTKEIIWEFQDKWNWKDLARKIDFTEDELLKVEDEFDWNDVVNYQKLSSEFIDNLIKRNKITTPEGWVRISCNQKLQCWFIEKYADKLKWFYVLANNKLDENFIEKYCKRFDYNDWCNCCRYQTFSEDFIERHKKDVDWDGISSWQKLSEPFIEKYARKLCWSWIFNKQKLSPEFIDKNINRVRRNSAWFDVCTKQELSEQFIRKYDKYLYWDMIGICQYLSEQLVRDYFKNIIWKDVKENKKCYFSPQFIQEMDILEQKTKPAWMRGY